MPEEKTPEQLALDIITEKFGSIDNISDISLNYAYAKDEYGQTLFDGEGNPVVITVLELRELEPVEGSEHTFNVLQTVYVDPETGLILDRNVVDFELFQFAPLSISNLKDILDVTPGVVGEGTLLEEANIMLDAKLDSMGAPDYTGRNSTQGHGRG